MIRDRTQAAAVPAEASPWQKYLSLSVICACQFLYLMDVFLLNVSAPEIQKEFDNPAVLKSVFAANQIAFAAFVFLGGRSGDLFGRRRLFIIGLVGAGLSALVAAYAETAATLIAARILQGMFGAFFVPQVMAILVGLFEEKERARAVGIYGMVIGFGGVAGFLSGGLLVELAADDIGWRSVFFFTGPCLLILAGLSLTLLPQTAPSQSQPLDLSSSGLLFAAGVLLVGPVAMAGLLPGYQLVLLFLSGLGVSAYLVIRQRTRMRSGATSLISNALAGDAAFRMGILTSFLFFLANTSFYLSTTLYLNEAFAPSALVLGLSYVPMGFAFVLGARIGSKRMHGVGPRAIRDGLTLQVGSLLLLCAVIAAGFSSHALVIALMVPFGFAQGHTMAPLIGLIVSRGGQKESGTASGAQQASQQFGNAAGVAALSGLYLAVVAQLGADTAILATLAILVLITAAACVAAQRLIEASRIG